MKPIQETYLYKEIHQQPDVIRRLVLHPHEVFASLAAKIQSLDIKQIYIAARGTSDNTGRYAQYLLGAQNQKIISLASPSLFTTYKQAPDLSGSLVVGISQSGKSPDIVSVVAEGKRQGALTAAITNNPVSDLAIASDFVLDLNADEEFSLAATKTYTAQLATIALLSAALNPSDSKRKDLLALPQHVSDVFALESQVASLVERYRYMTNCLVLGRGLNYATAFEFSIKMKELTYTHADPYSSADFMHGPFALVEQGTPVFLLAPGETMALDMKTMIEKVKERGAEVIVLSDQDELLKLADRSLSLPKGVPEWLSPITTIVPGQMFAMYLAKTRGYDPDTPRALNKVTETW